MKSDNEDKQTFWIVYADLMAGLFFVFILLVGGIIVKYVLTQSNLFQKERDFASAIASLKTEEQKNAELEALNKIFGDRLNEIDIQNDQLRRQNSLFILQIDDLAEIAKKLSAQSLDLNKSKSALEQTLSEQNRTIGENELKIAFLLEQLSEKERDFNQILHDLNVTKNRIRNLTGIKVKLIADLKESLGENITIDSNSGALTLSSSILFDKASSVLKDEAKPELEATLKSYFNVLLDSDEIRQNLDEIIIEGHTDSDGGYLYNLVLSQQRAFEVMKFINSWNTDARLVKYLIASGRSYMSPKFIDGVEDKDASRRIEIKFTLSNKEAIGQIQKFLEYDANRTQN